MAIVVFTLKKLKHFDGLIVLVMIESKRLQISY